MLHEFLIQHHDAIVERARAKVAQRRVPLASPDELAVGVPLFLGQLTSLLREERTAQPASVEPTSDARAHQVIGDTADRRGDALERAGLTVAQVIEGYGDVCQAITEHAVEARAAIGADEYRTLNLCVDVATARAVTAYAGARDRGIEDREVERLGKLAHELRNLLSSALLAYQALKGGGVGIDGSTGALLGRSLRGLRDLVDRSLAEVRIAATLVHPERVGIAQFLEEVEIAASLDAKARNLALDVPPVPRELAVSADRPLLASAVGNLVQNAVKFTPPGGRVSIRARRDAAHVHIEVEDQCGGLAGAAETMFRPFTQDGVDHTGLGLGLKIARDAVKANRGEISVRDLPGRGCVFDITLPVAP